MRAVIQRVSSSQVVADGVLTGRIGKGLTILFGVKKGDSERDAELLALKISKLRIFSDENDKRCLRQCACCLQFHSVCQLCTRKSAGLFYKRSAGAGK